MPVPRHSDAIGAKPRRIVFSVIVLVSTNCSR
jgi:hypothetical protein